MMSFHKTGKKCESFYSQPDFQVSTFNLSQLKSRSEKENQMENVL